MRIFKAPKMTGVDSEAVVQEARALIAKKVEHPARRAFLQRSLTLGGLSLLTGCSISDDSHVEAALSKISRINDKVQGLIFSPTQLAETYPASMITRLDEASVPAGRIYSVADIAADPHYLARGMLQTIAMGDGDALQVPGIVPKLSRTPGAQRRNAPRLGQDTDAVLAEIGLTPAQIAELKRRGVVAGCEA